MSVDPRTGLDLHVQGDAQPEVVANEHLLVTAFMASGNVKSKTTTAPPLSPAIGDAFVMPAGASGAWAPFAENSIAIWIGRWHNWPPPAGLQIFVEDAGLGAEVELWDGTAFRASA